MPLPSPKKGESKDKFIDRCMSDKAMNKEYPDKSQRRVVCESQWDKKDKAEANLDHVIQHLGETPWAILPDTLDTIHRIVAARLHNGKLSAEEIELQLGKDEQERGLFTTKEGVRIIPVHGVISKRMNLFTRISGGTSTELLGRDIRQALSDEDVKAIMLDVESPGGSVDGPFELSDLIFNSRGQKPIYAFANGLMASAAYLISSAADKIIASQAAQVGSIGVITAHYDYSKYDEKVGVKRTYLTAGKYKAISHDAAPLSKEGKDYIQEKLDYLYTMFVDSIARNRGVSTEKVLAEMADGKIFIGDQAEKVGLIDSIGTFEGSLTQCVEVFNNPITARKGTKEVTQMTLQELKKEHPELFAEFRTKVESDLQAKFDQEKKDLETKFAQEKSDLEKDFGTKLAERDDRILKLEKNDVVRTENERQREADRIWSGKLADSDIDPGLHDKVRAYVSHSQFVKDDVFDAEAFTTAVEAEIKDWESKLPKPSSVIGGGFSQKEVTDDKLAAQDAKDEKLADEIFEASGGKREEVK